MQVSRHVRITGQALRQWFIAQCYESLAVGLLWWAGLTWLQIPGALFWGFIAFAFQFIPSLGPVLAATGPLITALIATGFDGALYVLILYVGIVVLDGLLLQPVIMRRTARVPIWASLVVPLALGIFFGFWGLIVAAPLLAIIFAYRSLPSRQRVYPQQTPPGQVIPGGELIEPGTPTGHIPHRDEAL